MNYKSFNLGDWIGHISGVIEDETTLDGNEMRDLVEFLSMLKKESCSNCCNGNQIEKAKLCQKSYLAGMEHKQESRWIPVSERLPEEDGYYIVTENSGRVGTYVFHKEGNSEEYWKRCAVAWMPLPLPYKAESEDSNANNN